MRPGWGRGARARGVELRFPPRREAETERGVSRDGAIGTSHPLRSQRLVREGALGQDLGPKGTLHRADPAARASPPVPTPAAPEPGVRASAPSLRPVRARVRAGGRGDLTGSGGGGGAGPLAARIPGYKRGRAGGRPDTWGLARGQAPPPARPLRGAAPGSTPPPAWAEPASPSPGPSPVPPPPELFPPAPLLPPLPHPPLAPPGLRGLPSHPATGAGGSWGPAGAGARGGRGAQPCS